jgi:hypothetical protein
MLSHLTFWTRPYPWNERFLHDLPATVGSSNSPLWKDARINLVLGTLALLANTLTND